jgi:hypothetical protein
MNRVSILCILSASVLFASDGNGPLIVTATQSLPYKGTGVLRIEDSFGRLSIQGWDVPKIEITTIKSAMLPAERNIERSKQAIDEARVSVESNEGDVIITTHVPRYSKFKPPLPGAARVELEYRIIVPRAIPVVVRHGSGEVYIEGTRAPIDASIATGDILFMEPADVTYGIDARSRLGSVNSFAGGSATHSRWPLGSRLVFEAEAAPKCVLRAGMGDIAIFKSYANK